MRLLLFIFLSVFIWCNIAWSEEQLPDISKMSKKEINSLPPEIGDKLPIGQVYKALQKFDPKFQILEKILELDVKSALSKLMYIDIQEEALVKAIKIFQRDIGEQQTGVLTVSQFEKLTTRAERSSDNRFVIPVFGETIKIYKEKDYVFTEGTWRIEGEKIYAPINYSKIECHKSRGTCEIRDLDFLIPNLDKRDSDYQFAMNKQTYEIISWNDSEVISKSFSLGKCRSVIMTIDYSNNEVFTITRNKGTKGCDILGMVNIRPLNKPRISRLYSGYNKSVEFWKKREKETAKFMNPEYQKRLEMLEKSFLKMKQESK